MARERRGLGSTNVKLPTCGVGRIATWALFAVASGCSSRSPAAHLSPSDAAATEINPSANPLDSGRGAEPRDSAIGDTNLSDSGGLGDTGSLGPGTSGPGTETSDGLLVDTATDQSSTGERDASHGEERSRFVPEELPLETAPLVAPDEIEPAADGGVLPPMAVHLARFIWRQGPDATTVARAQNGDLDTADGVYQEALRLLEDPRAERGFLSFFGAWAEFSRAADLERQLGDEADPVRPPPGATLPDAAEFSRAVRAQLQAYVLDLVASGAGLRDLFLAPVEIQQSSLRALYQGEPATQRYGILSQPFLLAASAYADRTSPSRRGAYIARRVLCQDLAPTKESVRGTVPDELTTRQWIAGEAEDEECASCHADIDSLGYAFEGFDQFGRARITDHGQPIDSQVTLSSLGLPSADGPQDVAISLLYSPDTLPCLLSQWFGYALQRRIDDNDLPSWVELERGAEFYTLREIPALIAASQSFRALAR